MLFFEPVRQNARSHSRFPPQIPFNNTLSKQKRRAYPSFLLAQRKGFEPLYTFLHNTISNRARSTAPPSLQQLIHYISFRKKKQLFYYPFKIKNGAIFQSLRPFSLEWQQNHQIARYNDKHQCKRIGRRIRRRYVIRARYANERTQRRRTRHTARNRT